ncbi:hypothetical protein GWK47_013823 [Chionoecetes opilio]|uniref:Uncharacterized protein n=1 Tax=Chionoecetes opilio TaxID=41210 RepID=A0A8J4XU27_CHIOP|nr:hypothetical protein GWK47_013823 [Chionoecetes opilio]
MEEVLKECIDDPCVSGSHRAARAGSQQHSLGPGQRLKGVERRLRCPVGLAPTCPANAAPPAFDTWSSHHWGTTAVPPAQGPWQTPRDTAWTARVKCRRPENHTPNLLELQLLKAARKANGASLPGQNPNSAGWRAELQWQCQISRRASVKVDNMLES